MSWGMAIVAFERMGGFGAEKGRKSDFLMVGSIVWGMAAVW
jgi:hypothetical protein